MNRKIGDRLNFSIVLLSKEIFQYIMMLVFFLTGGGDEGF